MNWRRGLVLAGINLAISVPGFVWQEARFWPYTNTDVTKTHSARVEYVVFQEEVPVPLDPCHWFDLGYSRLEEVGEFANLPTALSTGWHGSCLTKSPLGRGVRRVIGARSHLAEVVDCACLSALVSIQWVLVGGFPLARPKHWWFEPGAFITAVALVGALVSFLPVIDFMSRIAEIFAVIGWLWWFGLLVWIPLHRAWRSTLGGLRRLTP